MRENDVGNKFFDLPLLPSVVRSSFIFIFHSFIFSLFRRGRELLRKYVVTTAVSFLIFCSFFPFASSFFLFGKVDELYIKFVKCSTNSSSNN